MPRAGKATAGAAKSLPRERDSLVAAYREGLGLAWIAIVGDAASPRIAVMEPGDADPDAETDVWIRWWCRGAADARRVAAAAARRMRALESRQSGVSSLPGQAAEDSRALSLAHDVALAAAQRLNVLLQSDGEIADEAALVAARVDAETEKLHQRGELKSVNRVYRNYRLDATARGERIVRYAEWMRKYKENLVRQTAIALREM
jgi:hypothetical protein